MLKDAHVIWIFAVALMGLISVRQMRRGYRHRLDWQAVDQNIGSYFVTMLDIEILLGIALWVVQGRWDGVDLTRSMNHPTIMLAAWIIVRFGWFQVRQSTVSESKFLRASIYFMIGLSLMTFGIIRIYGLF